MQKTKKRFRLKEFHHNMPKSQACPQCGSYCKRHIKTMGGAYYRCRTHGIFLMRTQRARELVRA